MMFLETEFGLEVARADVNGEVFHNIESLSKFVEERSRGVR